MEKVSLRHIYLEIGRMCNLKCIHCCKGEPEDAKMSDKVMDALLDNVHFIDEITITGGEPMLYTERIETLLDKCKKRNIKVNYFNVITNCTIKSEKFVRVFNAWHDYCTFGNDNELTISTDKYHKSYILEHLPDVNVGGNIRWYREKLKKCKFLPSTEKMIDNDVLIFNEGRVRNWEEKQKERYMKIEECNRKKNAVAYIPIRCKCEGEENICKYGCVYNCIRQILYINPYGDIFLDTFISFELQNKCEDIRVGNILSNTIYDLVSTWNEELKNADFAETQIELKNEILTKAPDKIKALVLNANTYSSRGNFGEAEKEIEKIKLFTSLCVKERNKIIEKVNNAIDLYEKNNDIMDKGQFKEFVKNICEVDQSAIPLKEIIEQITNIEKIFKQRKESNNPGSLFIEPEYDYIKAFFDIASLFKK